VHKIPNIVLIFPTSLVSLAGALVITWLAWEVLIPGKAFQCRDDGFDIGFWTSAETHRSAGDNILPGWTWERLEHVNNAYKLAFVAIWMGCSFGSFRFLNSILHE
jgi:hypothetical protein